MAINPVRRVFDFLAKMGLMVRDDPPRVIDAAARKWGEAASGFSLSIEQMEGMALSVLLRNVSGSPQKLSIPAWSHFYLFDIDAPLSPFGTELLKPERQPEPIAVNLAPGEPFETQVPLGSLFILTRKAEHRVVVSCTLPSGASLTSNTIAISA